MSLEPEKVASLIKEDDELIDMNRRFWIAAFLSLPLLIISMIIFWMKNGRITL